MKMTNEDYGRYVKGKSPNSKTAGNMVKAFVVGGLICCIGQALTGAYQALGMGKETAGTVTAVTLVFLGVALTALGVYDRIARFAGAGTLVPITGFANSVAAPAIDFKSDERVIIRTVRKSPISG